MNKVKELWASFLEKWRMKNREPLFQFAWKIWHLIGAILLVVLVICVLVLNGIQNSIVNHLVDQRMAQRWSEENDYAQVSLFFPYGTEMTDTDVKRADYEIGKALEEISVYAENPSQRMFVSCWYSKGTISVTRNTNTANVDAIGISGDFFLFHPMEFVSGGAIPADSVLKDYVVLDEKTAWNLFGATDVAGMEVRINEVPHIISGVVKVPEDKLYRTAGAKENLIYVTNESLAEYGTVDSAIGYELLMPEPYDNFAMKALKKSFEDYKKTGEWIDNSKRFEVKHLWDVWKALDGRTMQTKPIILPYWENVSRFYENKLIRFWEFRIIMYVMMIIITVSELVSIWKMRTFDKETMKDAWIHMVEGIRKKRKQHHEKEEQRV